MLRSKMGVHPKVASWSPQSPSHDEEAAEKIWHFPPRGSSATFLRILRTPALWVGSSSARWGNFATVCGLGPDLVILCERSWFDWMDTSTRPIGSWILVFSTCSACSIPGRKKTLPKTIATHSESVVTNASPFTSGRSLFLFVLS